jgi:oligopeptide transport system substrate-binding protein
MCLFATSNKSPNSPNYTRYQNAEMDALIEQATITTDFAMQQYLFAKADSLLQEELPVIPLFYDEVIRVVNKRVTHFPVNGINMLLLKEADFGK